MSKDNAKKMSGKKVALIIIGCALAAVVVGGIVIGIIVSKFTGSMGSNVEVINPTTKDISSTISTSGIISSDDVTTYTSPVNAPISEINVKAGQTVKKGDVIVTFDTTDLEDQYNQANLSAQSSKLQNQTTVDAANQQASKANSSQSDVDKIKSKISTLDKEISTLSTANNNTSSNDLNTTIAEKQIEYQTAIDAVQTIIDNTPAGEDYKANADYVTAATKRDNLKLELENLESANSLLSTDNDISATLSAKMTELEGLKSQLSAAEQAVESYKDASTITSTQQQQINVSNQMASLQVDSAAANLEEGKAGILADSNGIITTMDLTKGTYVSDGTPLYTIADASKLKVVVQLTKRDLESVELGQEATITVLNKEYKGTVSYISKLATTSATGSTTIDAEITIDNADDSIVLGLDAKVIINTSNVSDVLTIPSIAVNTDTESTFVYTVDENTIVKKYIETGVSDLNNTEIISGIDKDTMVISNVTAYTIEGSIVNPVLKDSTDSSESTKEESEN